MDVNSVKEKSLKKFDAEASSYENTSDGKFCSRIYPAILEKVNDRENQVILDVGCGPGTILSQINGENSLFGIDLSQSMIETAKNNLGDKAQLLIGDAENLPFENEMFDTVLCTFSFHHYPKPHTVLNEMYRVLKKGGYLILADPTLPLLLRQIANVFLKFSDDGDVRMYAEKDISELLEKSGFKIQSFDKPTNDSFLLTACKQFSSNTVIKGVEIGGFFQRKRH